MAGKQTYVDLAADRMQGQPILYISHILHSGPASLLMTCSNFMVLMGKIARFLGVLGEMESHVRLLLWFVLR